METPAKYERDSNYLNHPLDESKFPVTEKLTNGALVTPTPNLTKSRSREIGHQNDAKNFTSIKQLEPILGGFETS